MDEAAKQRFRMEEESRKANIEEELSLQAAGESRLYWRSGKHTFLTTQTDAPDDAWEEEITGWDPAVSSFLVTAF